MDKPTIITVTVFGTFISVCLLCIVSNVVKQRIRERTRERMGQIAEMTRERMRSNCTIVPDDNLRQVENV